MTATSETYPVHSDGGSPLRTILPEEGTARFDPFLVFHEQGPVAYRPGEAIGFPDHPHRGFETITYVLAGEQQHHDSFGHAGTLRAGDVQWMTAARGIVHSELPTPAIYRDGGLVHALQIWINLPATRKMERPRYQDVTAARLPVRSDETCWMRLIAGSAAGLTSPIDTGRPVLFAHLRMRRGGSQAFETPVGSTVLVYAMSGNVLVNGDRLAARHLRVLRSPAASLTLEAPDEFFEGVVLAAVPLGEPVVSRGPFVMNTRLEIERAYDEYMAGTLGVDAVDG